MSKKNDLGRRKRLHEYELRKEKEEREKRERKLKARQERMKIDGKDTNKKKKKRQHAGFKVGNNKKVKTKLTALVKAKAAQAMEIDS